jgi:hypothetical protein
LSSLSSDYTSRWQYERRGALCPTVSHVLQNGNLALRGLSSLAAYLKWEGLSLKVPSCLWTLMNQKFVKNVTSAAEMELYYYYYYYYYY